MSGVDLDSAVDVEVDLDLDLDVVDVVDLLVVVLLLLLLVLAVLVVAAVAVAVACLHAPLGPDLPEPFSTVFFLLSSMLFSCTFAVLSPCILFQSLEELS